MFLCRLIQRLEIFFTDFDNLTVSYDTAVCPLLFFELWFVDGSPEDGEQNQNMLGQSHWRCNVLNNFMHLLEQ